MADKIGNADGIRDEAERREGDTTAIVGARYFYDADAVREEATKIATVIAKSVAVDPTRVREQTTLNEIAADFGPTAAESRAAAEFFADAEAERTVEIDPKKFLINDPTLIEGTFAFNAIPWFPFTITVQPGVSITLTADGKWEGSTEAFRDAMANGSSMGVDASFRIVLWLLLRAMESDKRFW
jgi:hypothetical protein